MIRISTLMVAVLLLSGSAAYAEEDQNSANWVMPGCRAFAAPSPPLRKRDISVGGVCTGAVWAVRYLDTAVCSPLQATADQAVRVVAAYIDARPARLHENFYLLAQEALRAAWPCR
jgi:hypothetical protein